ncbi:M47 protein [Murid betaherpesvirus 1]|uniref:M47 protein n=1 Tax=Murid herpesvirus 1 TaxID=10366 RepID=H2A2P6_MUHV1|nr:M47 protein [Murid betaherpesvirus 1]
MAAFAKDHHPHVTRALNLEQTLEDLRMKTACDEDLLNILAKIEISAVQLQTVTASRVRRFLQHVPETGYHFEFIRRHPVFYFLNHGTFGPAQKGLLLPLAADLVSELRKYTEKSQAAGGGSVGGEDKTSKLSNERVLQTLSEFLEGAARVSDIQQGLLDSDQCLIDEETDRPQGRGRREFTDADLKTVEKLVAATQTLRNCRAVAELLEELHHTLFEFFRLSLTTQQLRRDGDTQLDAVVKIIHCHDNHAATPALETDFQKAIDRASAVLAEICTTDIHQIQQLGSEYTRDASFKISSRSLSAKERSDLRFPILTPSVSVLRHISPANVLFYPGVVFAILRTAARVGEERRQSPGGTPPQRRRRLLTHRLSSFFDAQEKEGRKIAENDEKEDEEEEEDDDDEEEGGEGGSRQIHAFNDFCVTIADILFTQTQESSRSRLVSVKDVIEKTRAFYRLGLTPKSTATYIRMISLHATYRTAAASRSIDEFSEAADHITFLVYNAHLHFLCLSRYSNTFLFYHAKRLILEQQRSLLTGNRSLQDVWANVAFNINRLFALRYDEEEFTQLTLGASPAGREYLYRDAANKWDDIAFTLDQEDLTDPLPLPPQEDPTPEDIARACELVDAQDAHSYNSLLPLSTYPDFDKTLTEKIIIPRIEAIVNAMPAEIRAHDDMRLLKLIHICRLLMPRRLELYRNLVSLYNLLHYVSQTDLGLVKVLYGVIRNVVLHLGDITGDSYSFNSELLEDLAIESFLHALGGDITEALARWAADRRQLAERFAEHCATCYSLTKSVASLYTNTHSVVLTGKNEIVTMVALPEFTDTLRKIAADNAELEERLRFLSNTGALIVERLRSLTEETRSIPTFTDLTFSTRSITKLYARLSETLQTNQATLESLCVERLRFNRAACESFSSLASACRTMDADRIRSRGLRRCVADALTLMESHRAPHSPPKRQELDRESIGVLKKLFDPYRNREEAPAPPLRRRNMSGRPRDASVDFRYEAERYVPVKSPNDLREWYVETKEKVQQDLTNPLRLARNVQKATA